MWEESKITNHLIRNLDRISYENSIFNYKTGRKAFLSLGQENIEEWLDNLLPNTRIIIEPQIIGSGIGIQYLDGKLDIAINKNSVNITESVKSLKNIPRSINFKDRIQIRGVIYNDKYKSTKKIETELLEIKKPNQSQKNYKFCAFQILNCNLNHFQSLQELKDLDFEIPQTQFTKYITDINIYLQCWKDGKLFEKYPTNGIVLKINSRKLQKYLGQNDQLVHWAYAIS